MFRVSGNALLAGVLLAAVVVLTACNGDENDRLDPPEDAAVSPTVNHNGPTPDPQPAPGDPPADHDEPLADYQFIAVIDEWDELLRPVGPLATDYAGSVFVLTAETIHQFNYEGQFQNQIGDGFGALPGQFRNPRGIVVGSNGDLYVLDAGNERMQLFSPDGALSVTWPLEPPDGLDPIDPLAIDIDSRDRIYLTDARSRNVLIYSSTGEYLHRFGGEGDEPGEFETPVAITVGRVLSPDEEEFELVLVADAYFGDVQVFSTEGDYLGVFGTSETGPEALQVPWDIALDDRGGVYIVDRENYRVQKFELDLAADRDGVANVEARFVSSWGERGFDAGQFELPGGITVSADDRIYVVDEINGLQVFDSDGEFMTSWNTTRERLLRPSGIAADDQHIYVANTGLSSVAIFDRQFDHVETLRHAGLRLPFALALDGEGRLWVADVGLHNEVLLLDQERSLIDFWDFDGQLDTSTGLAFDDHDRAYIADRNNDRIVVVTYEDGRIEFDSQWGTSGDFAGDFQRPTGITAFENEIFLTDSLNHRVQVFDTNGDFLRAWGRHGNDVGELDQPSGVTVSHEGFVHVADTMNHRVQIFTRQGDFVAEFGVPGRDHGQFDRPFGVAVDDGGVLYVADTGNHRVQVLAPDN